MANAGYSADNKFITEAIRSGKLIAINPNEHPLIQIFKEKINNLLLNDVVTPYKHSGRTYYSHSAWSNDGKVLIKINQIRQKNWFWDKLL